MYYAANILPVKKRGKRGRTVKSMGLLPLL